MGKWNYGNWNHWNWINGYWKVRNGYGTKEKGKQKTPWFWHDSAQSFDTTRLQVCMSSEIHETKPGTIHYEPRLPLGGQRQGFGFMLNVSYSDEVGKLWVSLHLLLIGLSRGSAPVAGEFPRRFIFRLDGDQQSKSAPTAIVVCFRHWAIHSRESWCHRCCRSSIYMLRWW